MQIAACTGFSTATSTEGATITSQYPPLMRLPELPP
jgi:hypothetical protein